jgi:YD repeat-containing protein
MVATVVGSRLGLQQTSAFVLGSRVQIGNASLGRGGENVFVNGMTGNLVISNRDEFLVGQGPDAGIDRVYNSRGDFADDNGDNWWTAVRKVQGLTGTVNTAGSTISRRDWDGSVVVYTYDTGRNLYISREGSGAYDTLTYGADSVLGVSAWKWQDGDTGVSEVYDPAQNNQIQRSMDRDGNAVTYTYVGGLISRVTTQDGARTDFTWAGSNLTQLSSTWYDTASSTWKTQTRTRYGYDADNRLTSVTVDLSPGDNSIADGRTYVTTYTYDGTSKRVASITQTDGSKIEIEYEPGGDHRVTAIVQHVAEGVKRRTEYTYVAASGADSARVEIKDVASNLTTTLEYDAAGQLTKIIQPAATAGGAPQVREFTYDAEGNLIRIKTSATTWTDYVYGDTDGNGAVLDVDANGVREDINGLWTAQYEYTGSGGYIVTRRTFNAMNGVLTETRYATLDADGTDAVSNPTGAMTTRYVYDSENHLIYSLSAEGDLTQYDYRTDGNLVRTVVYRARYDVSALAWNATPTAAVVGAWSAGLVDKSAVDITEYIYDPVTQALSWTASYSNVSPITGGADGGSPTTRTYYTYDQAGRLLSRRVGGLGGTETFIYDGLGRMVSTVDYNGAATSTAFLDVSGTTVIRQANGLNQIMVYNRAGELVTRSETDRSENLVQLAGWPQGAPPAGFATVPGWSNPAAYVAETQWATVIGPGGREIVAIQAGQSNNTVNGGGNITNATPTADRSKAYEFVYYFRKSDLNHHSIYFGPNTSQLENGATGAADTNPYFFHATASQQQAMGLQNDRWYKVVGYILPQGSGLAAAGSLGGVYDMTNGAKIASTTSYRWNESSANESLTSRFFDFYDENQISFSTYFYQPEIRTFQGDQLNDLLPATGTQYRYDAQGRLRVQIDPTGIRTHYMYDRVGRKVAEIDGDGSLVEYKYDAADRVIATVRYSVPLSPAQIASLSDAAGNPTSVELDALRPATGAANDSWTWTVYDGAGRVLRTIDSEGGATTYAYDGASRLLTQTRHGTRFTASEITGFKTTPPTATPVPAGDRNRVTRFFYDAVGRQTGSLDAAGYLTGITYDSSGRVIGSVAYANLTSDTLWVGGTFDALKNSITLDAGRDVRNWSVYDRRGFLRGTVNGEGEVTLYDYDALGQVTQVTRGRKLDPQTTQPTLSQLTSAPVPEISSGVAGVLETVTYTRNNYGQVLTEARTVAGGVETITYTYDTMRQLIGMVTDVAVGVDRTVLQRYDRRGRLIGQLSAEGAAELAALGSGATKAQIDQIYRRRGTTFTYDDADRLISRTDPDGTYGAAGAKSLFYYDADGRLIFKINPAGEAVAYKYDALGRLIETREHISRVITTGLTGGKVTTALSSQIVNGNSDRRTAIVYNTDNTVRTTTTWIVDSASAALWYNSVNTSFAVNGYNAFGEVISRVEERGAFTAVAGSSRTTYAYDKRGLMTETVQDAGGIGKATSATYDAFGRAVETVDANNQHRTTAYDRAGRVLEVGDAFGKKTIYGYDARGNTVSVQDRDGGITRFSYSAFNREVAMVTPTGIQTTTTYDDRGLKLTIAVNGKTESFSYDRNGNLLSATDGAGDVTAYTYDFADRVYEVTDATSRKTRYSYDAANRRLTETRDPGDLNLTTTYFYDGLGQTVRIVDAAGVRTDYKFDLLGRVTEVNVDPTGLAIKTVSTYDRAGNLVRLREAAGGSAERDTLFTYDALGRMTARENGDASLNIRSEYTYDKNGNATRRRDKIDATTWVETRFVYDAENRLILTVNPTGGVTRTIYDAEGRVTRTIGYADALDAAELAGLGIAPTEALVTAGVPPNTATDHSTALIYDADGRLTFSLNGIGQLSQNVYDGSGNVIRQILYATAYTVSQAPTQAALLNWVNTHTTADDRITRATYDAANRQVFSIDAGGQVTAFFYDDAGRSIRSIRFATPHDTAGDRTVAQMQSWATGNAATGDRKTHAAYDTAGRLSFTVDAEGYMTRTTYDGMDNAKSSTRFEPRFSVADGDTHAILTGKITAALEATAVTTAWAYDSAGRLIKTTDAVGVITLLDLNGLGQVTAIHNAWGTAEATRTNRSYDDGGRLTVETRAFGGGDAQQTLSWTYDGLGRVLISTDGNGQPTLRTYDAMGRALTVTSPISSSRAALTQNQYDVFGNLVRVIDPVGSTQAVPTDWAGHFFYDKLNRLVLQVDPERFATRTEYGLGGQVTSVTRYATRVTGSVNTAAQPTVTTSVDDATTRFEHDKLDRLTKVIDAESKQEIYTLNAFGDRVGVTNKVNATTTYTYDRRGLMLTEVLPVRSVAANGTVLATSITNTYEYDSRGNLKKTIEASNVASDTRTTLYAYDQLDRLILKTGDDVTITSSTTPATPTESITYDKRGNVIETRDAGGARTLFYYDAMNRKVREINALGTVRTWAYDDNNNATSAQVYEDAVALPATGAAPPALSGNFRETFFEYDRANRLTATTVKNVRAGEYGAGYTSGDIVSRNVHDANGNVVEVINGRGDSSFAFYDKLGRQVGSVDAEGYLTTLERDAEGNVTREVRYGIRVAGTVTSGSLVTGLAPRTADAALGDRITEFTYDLNGRRETETRFGVAIYAGPPAVDRLTTANALISYAYDGLGNVTRKTEANGDYIDYGYDALGRMVSALTSKFTDDTGSPDVQRRTLTFYDGLGGVTRVEDGKDNAGLVAGARVTTYSYVKGRLASTTDGEGFTRSFGYDIMGRVTLESYVRKLSTAGLTVTEGQRYGYDLLGRLTEQSSASFNSTWTFGDTRKDIYNTYGEVSERRLNNVVQETFSYDNVGRLWRSTAGDGVARYMLYDKAGRASLTVTPTGGMANYTDLEALVTWLSDGGTQAIGAVERSGAAMTFNLYDKRGLSTGTREPFRELGRDPDTLVMTTQTIVRGRTFNAFGEVETETDARGYTTEFSYNTMGRIIERRMPMVEYINTSGAKVDGVPTEQSRYDISGRLVATRSANGFWTLRTLLANTGHGGSEAVVLATYNPDGGQFLNKVNVFGELTKVGTGLVQVGTNIPTYITNVYDNVGRLVQRWQVERTAGSIGNATMESIQLKDFYGYDGLGRRITHTNNVAGFGAAVERTDYDAEGRVILQTDFEGRATLTTYAWDQTLQTNGLGTFGGWVKTTQHTSGKISSERTDAFGRTVGRTDMGGRIYTMTFDQAGRQVLQQSTLYGAALQHVSYSWYNTGLMAEQNDLSLPSTGYTTSRIKGSFTYDADGNRLRERYFSTETVYAVTPDLAWDPYLGIYPAVTVSTQTKMRQDAYATYDKLGRRIKFEDKADSVTEPVEVKYGYDLNGNVRMTESRYRRIGETYLTPVSLKAIQYDSMDRMASADSPMGGTILYDAAGNRVGLVSMKYVGTDIVNGEAPMWVPYVPIENPHVGETGTNPHQTTDDALLGEWVLSPTYETRYGWATEHYEYTADGYLARVSRSADLWDTVNKVVYTSDRATITEDERDALGRVTKHTEFGNSAPGYPDGTVTHWRTVGYDKSGLMTTETNYTYNWANSFNSTGAYYSTVKSDYSYTEGSTWRGVVTSITTSGSGMPTGRTDFQYTWWDSALQSKITIDDDISKGGGLKTSILAYDANGHVAFVNIKDGRNRNVTFITDPGGQVMLREEVDTLATLDPTRRFYYFGGQRQGEVSNDGVNNDWKYSSEIYWRRRPANAFGSPFKSGMTVPNHIADFNLAYEGIYPSTTPTNGRAWTVRTGDTLQSIAASAWGDASLWYLLADVNGMTSGSALSAGQSITIPAKFGNIHHNSDTFRPYDPNSALGDLSPSHPTPPKKPGGCGMIGMMLMTLIAVAVAAIVAPYAIAAIAGNGMSAATVTAALAGGATGISAAGISTTALVAGSAVAGAAGSIASQAFGLAIGAQDKFDWKGVAMSAIASGVGAGLNGSQMFGRVMTRLAGPNQVAQRMLTSATANAVTQGVAVATGAQHKFDWVSVGVSAISAGIGSELPDNMVGDFASNVISVGARSILEGSSFGDNLMSQLPQIIGQTIGNQIARGERAKPPKGDYSPGENADDTEVLTLPDPVRLQPLDAWVPSVSQASEVPLPAPSASRDSTTARIAPAQRNPPSDAPPATWLEEVVVANRNRPLAGGEQRRLGNGIAFRPEQIGFEDGQYILRFGTSFPTTTATGEKTSSEPYGNVIITSPTPNITVYLNKDPNSSPTIEFYNDDTEQMSDVYEYVQDRIIKPFENVSVAIPSEQNSFTQLWRQLLEENQWMLWVALAPEAVIGVVELAPLAAGLAIRGGAKLSPYGQKLADFGRRFLAEESGSVRWPFGRQAAEIAGDSNVLHNLSTAEISALNRAAGGRTVLTGDVETVLANMSYRDGFNDQAAVAIRDIAGRHLFNDGNKRTAQAFVEQFAERNGVAIDRERLRIIIDQAAQGRIRSIEEISAALSGASQ